MGGNAIKQLGVEGRRVDMQEFAAIEKHVAKILNLENIGFGVVQAYKKKETFGDMDVVLKTEHLEMVRQLIESHFRPKVISRNHNIFSFDYDNFQIDFICYGGDTFQSALDYFVYSPAGNAVGKIAHQLGLSYGHDGLKYIIREEMFGCAHENSHIMEEVVLSRDTKRIHEFLQLDHKKWQQGFETQEEIFEWVCRSGYFSPRPFAFENMNHIARIRDRKRPDYNQFLDYIEKNKGKFPDYKRQENKKDYLVLIGEYFPVLKEAIAKNKIKYEKKVLFKSKFNGKIVSEITGYEGKELGSFIRALKDAFGDFEAFVEELTAEETRKLIEVFYKLEEATK